jgi:SIR2-like domain
VKDSADSNLSRTLSLVLGGIQLLRGQLGIFPESNFNVEEVAATLESLRFRHSHQLSPFVGSWNEFLRLVDSSREDRRDCLKELRDLLQDKIKGWLKTPPIGEIRYFQSLQDFVKAFGSTDVFTLNYDRCVEAVLGHCDIPFTCGFDVRGWNSELFENSSIKVRLYKLHGSLDWYRDEEDQAVYSLQCSPEDRILAADHPPLLIFGTSHKLTATDPFLYLSYRFSEMVKTRTVIAIIGYGFGDEYINQIILQGLSRDSRKRLLVVDKGNEGPQRVFRERFAQAEIFLDAGRVEFVDGGAKKVLNDGILLDRLKSTLKEATHEGPFSADF